MRCRQGPLQVLGACCPVGVDRKGGVLGSEKGGRGRDKRGGGLEGVEGLVGGAVGRCDMQW